MVYFEITRLPPRRFRHDITCGAGDQKFPLRLHAQTAGSGGQAVAIAQICPGVEIDPVFRFYGLKPNLLIIVSEQFQDRQQTIASQLRKTAAVFRIPQLSAVRPLQFRETGLHASDIPYDTAAGYAEEFGKSGAVGRLDPLKQNQVSRFRTGRQLRRLLPFQTHRLLT